MKYNKYTPDGKFKIDSLSEGDKEWRIGWNICKVIRFLAAPKPNHVLYKVTLRNIHDVILELAYIVPNGKPPHDLLKDLKRFNDGSKPWLQIKLDFRGKLPVIEGMGEVKEHQDELTEMNELSKRRLIV